MIVIHSASQLVTPTKLDFSVIGNGAIVAEDDRIVFVGTTSEALASYPNAEKIDASGKVIIPGFVDAHTHLIFCGDRCNEFLMRLRGATYEEIAAAGGGILSTVKATREASADSLLENAQRNIEKMMQHGTTTVEIKSGYGLNWESELKLLNVAHQLKERTRVDIAVTFLGAHAFPREKTREEYIRELTEEMLPRVAEANLAEFCDVFCDQGYYTIEQSRAIGQKAKEVGLKMKLHVDELADVGGAALAGELKAISADHLIFANHEGIRKMAESQVCAVLLPGTSFALKMKQHAPARLMIQSGVRVAIASDFNPGTCFCHSMQYILQLAPLLYSLTAEEALTAATLNAAAAIARDNSVGSLETGKQMDCLILDIPDYGHLFYNLGENFLETVIKKGKITWSKNQRLN